MAGKRMVACTSTGCLEYAPERYKKYGIEILRVHVHFNGKEYLEGLDLDPVKFYEQLETLKDPKSNLPYTSMPTTEDINALYQKAIDQGCEEIIIVAISSGLGGTYNLIRLIGEDYKDKIKVTVIDSRTVCFVEGLMAVKIAELVEKGLSTDDILKEVAWIKERQQFIGIDGKLDYLIYNGRLKGAKAFMGKMMNICPCIHLDRNGEIVPIASVRTQKKALHRTCEELKAIIGDRSENDYILFHIYTGPSVVKELEEIEKEYGIKCNHEAVIMSPVSGCHNGPWLAGYGYIPVRKNQEILE